MKRCIAFCLALGAALSLTACGGGDTEGGLLCEASGIRPDTVLLSVDGRDVSAQRYLYWLAYACDYIADYYDSGEGIQWGDTVSGQSLEDYAKDQALQNAALYATVETWAEDYGCTLTDEDRTAMDREWAARAAQYGGEEAYLAVLARMGLDRASLGVPVVAIGVPTVVEASTLAADLLGHADTAFLERTYCHPQDTCKEQAAGLLDTMLQPADAVAWEREQKMLEAKNQ